jgi:hypothetical protein
MSIMSTRGRRLMAGELPETIPALTLAAKIVGGFTLLLHLTAIASVLTVVSPAKACSPPIEGDVFQYTNNGQGSGPLMMPQADAVGAAMREAVSSGAQGAVVRGSPFFSSTQRQMIVDSAALYRLPAIYERRDDAERGGLVSYAPDIKDQYRATAEYVIRIIAGAKPGELPIQQPTKFEMVINLKTARALGLEVPPSLLARADEVIE